MDAAIQPCAALIHSIEICMTYNMYEVWQLNNETGVINVIYCKQSYN
jgi:hypothetical protein